MAQHHLYKPVQSDTNQTNLLWTLKIQFHEHFFFKKNPYYYQQVVKLQTKTTLKE